MRKSSKKIQFFIAFLVVSLVTSLIVIIFRSEVIKVWLRWIEFLSNVPGLSGLASFDAVPRNFFARLPSR